MHAVRTLLAVAALALALPLTSCAPAAPAGSSNASGRIGVVAGENFWGSIAQQIGGDRVAVTSIISDPDADPHEYETSATDAAAIASARLVIENGVGYDDFLAKLLSAQPSRTRAVLSVQRVLHVTARDANPHLWYDTARIPTVARAIAQQLAEVDPAHATAFAANERRFDAALQPIDETVAAIKAKYAGTRIAYTERVPGYLTTAAGLRLGMPTGFTEAVEQGNDPSPADDLAFQRAIRNRTVRLLLVNGQVVDEQTTRIQRLAAAAHVPVVRVTETIPGGEDYQTWQLRQARAILAALGG